MDGTSEPPEVLVDVPDGLGVIDVLAHEDLASVLLIDGHHKVAAYRAERLPPLLIEITPLQPRPLTRAHFRRLLRDPEPFARLLTDWDWSSGRG